MGRESDARDAAERERTRIAFSRGPKLFDRFARPLMMGCELEFHDSLPPVYQIIDIKPDLRKEVPADAFVVTLRADLIITAVSGYPMDKATLIRLPAVIADAPQDQGQPEAAASDASAAPPSSIVLTDMDRTARETLAAVEPASSLRLVHDQPAELPDPPTPPDEEEPL